MENEKLRTEIYAVTVVTFLFTIAMTSVVGIVLISEGNWMGALLILPAIIMVWALTLFVRIFLNKYNKDKEEDLEEDLRDTDNL